MRLFKPALAFLLIITMMSCIERKTRRTSDLDSNMIQSLEGPRVIRDTIIQVVLLDTVDNRRDVAQQEPVQQQPKVQSAPAPRSNSYEREDDYDGSNSGFFDNYRSNYGGDPNKGLQPTTRVVKSNADEVEQRKQEIARSLNQLEQRNQEELQRQEQQERERDEYNARAIERAKEEQRRQQQQQQQKRQPQGKTLGTNILLDNN